MPVFRVTVRHGEQRYHYHVDDVEAADLREALRLVVERLPADAAAGDLAEVRRMLEPEERSVAPE